jgi:hypothetical protein
MTSKKEQELLEGPVDSADAEYRGRFRKFVALIWPEIVKNWERADTLADAKVREQVEKANQANAETKRKNAEAAKEELEVVQRAIDIVVKANEMVTDGSGSGTADTSVDIRRLVTEINGILERIRHKGGEVTPLSRLHASDPKAKR